MLFTKNIIVERENTLSLPNNSPNQLLDLRGRTALVTGAAGRIGKAIARQLAAAGASVIAHGRVASDSLAELAADINASGGRCIVVTADLADAAAVDDMFDALREQAVDQIVNNAAVQPVRALADMTLTEWRHMQSVNLDAAFLITQRAARAMAARGVSGAVVNISSIEGQDPAVGHAHYATSKAGLAMLTRAAALELGRDGIRVNTVSPGLINQDALADTWPEGVQRWQNNVPLGRLGEAEDIADAVLFLLSPAARWITGANLIVDGGMSTVSRW